MKVFGAGLPRTGTLSLKIALESLGLAPCYHMVNVLSDLSESPRWSQAIAGDLPVTEILAGYPASVDWPGSFFYREMLDLYPDAKVILSLREPRSWARSMQSTIWGMFYDDTLTCHLSRARAFVDPSWDYYLKMMIGMWESSGLLDGEHTTLESMSDAMIRYNDEVKATVPADRLLVWSASDGWEPICQFLGVDVPGIPFPRVNGADQFDGRIIDAALQVLQASRTVATADAAHAPVPLRPPLANQAVG